jgi:hypothetical protein
MHFGPDLQTWALFMSAGSAIWWPFCIYVCITFGYAHSLPLLMVGMALPYAPIPKYVVNDAITSLKRQMRTVFVEPPTPIGCSPEVILMLPHGFISLEALSVYIHWISENKIDSTVFVDQALCALPGASVVFTMFGLNTDRLKHKNIEYRMKMQQNVAVMPGGFAESIGGTDSEQIVYLGTVSYWIKQCKKHGYALRVFHVYNGSDMIQQSSVCLQSRVRFAQKYHIPLLLPTAINKISRLVVRCLFYANTGLPTTGDIQSDLVRYTDVDKLSPLFPAPQRKYTILSHL